MMQGSHRIRVIGTHYSTSLRRELSRSQVHPSADRLEQRVTVIMLQSLCLSDMVRDKAEDQGRSHTLPNCATLFSSLFLEQGIPSAL